MTWAKIALGLVNLFKFVADWLRTEQAKADGKAIEAGQNAQVGLEVSQGMANAQAKSEQDGAVLDALDKGEF